MLSRDCDGCSQMKDCAVRYRRVDGTNDRQVYCPDGTAHLIDDKVCPAISASNYIVHCDRDGDCINCDLPTIIQILEAHQ